MTSSPSFHFEADWLFFPMAPALIRLEAVRAVYVATGEGDKYAVCVETGRETLIVWEGGKFACAELIGRLKSSVLHPEIPIIAVKS